MRTIRKRMVRDEDGPVVIAFGKRFKLTDNSLVGKRISVRAIKRRGRIKAISCGEIVCNPV